MELRNRIYERIVDAIERKDELFHPQIIDDLNEIADSGRRKVHISLSLQLKDVGSKFLLCGALTEGGVC